MNHFLPCRFSRFLIPLQLLDKDAAAHRVRRRRSQAERWETLFAKAVAGPEEHPAERQSETLRRWPPATSAGGGAPAARSVCGQPLLERKDSEINE